MHVTNDTPQTHELKCWPEFFSAILDGTKTFEVRRADRPFTVGDTLWLREYEPLSEAHYTGRELRATVTYILYGVQWGATGAEHVVMGFRSPASDPHQRDLADLTAIVEAERRRSFNTNWPEADKGFCRILEALRERSR